MRRYTIIPRRQVRRAAADLDRISRQAGLTVVRRNRDGLVADMMPPVAAEIAQTYAESLAVEAGG